MNTKIIKNTGMYIDTIFFILSFSFYIKIKDLIVYYFMIVLSY
jgi:hypothetical protein